MFLTLLIMWNAKNRHLLGSLLPPKAKPAFLTLSRTSLLQCPTVFPSLSCSHWTIPTGKQTYFNTNDLKPCLLIMLPIPASSHFLLPSTPILLQSLDYTCYSTAKFSISPPPTPRGPHSPGAFSTTYTSSKSMVSCPFSSYPILFLQASRHGLL